MNPAALFLIGGVGMAVVLSIVVWLFSRPRTRVEDPNELRRTLRSLRSSSPSSATPVHGDGGLRVLGREDWDVQPGRLEDQRDG